MAAPLRIIVAQFAKLIGLLRGGPPIGTRPIMQARTAAATGTRPSMLDRSARRGAFQGSARLATAVLASAFMSVTAGVSIAGEVLQLEAKIGLGEVRGRIDHLAIDVARQRLFVAELGNNTIGVVDLKAGKLQQRLTGFAEPQGVGYASSTDTLFVANGGSGAVDLFRGLDLVSAGRTMVGGDADNIRVDRESARVFVGFNNGLAALDPSTGKVLLTIPLEGHAEGFQLDPAGPSIFVNIPARNQIAVADRIAGKVTAIWRTGATGNFPIALDTSGQRVLSVFRGGIPLLTPPATLRVFNMKDGSSMASAAVCGDPDDLFLDAARGRVYVVCGEGAVDILDAQTASFAHLGQVKTAPGARTGLYVPEIDRLFVAVSASGNQPAAVWVFKPLQ